MRAELYWIEASTPGRMAVAPRPRGGEWMADEVALWRDQGVDVVVCLLTDDELEELGLTEEAALCSAAGLTFLRLPIIDGAVPDSHEKVSALTGQLALALSGGRSVLIHCRAGIGRSGVIAAATLMRLGSTPEAALAAITAARGIPVPETLYQRQWVVDLRLDEQS